MDVKSFFLEIGQVKGQDLGDFERVDVLYQMLEENIWQIRFYSVPLCKRFKKHLIGDFQNLISKFPKSLNMT